MLSTLLTCYSMDIYQLQMTISSYGIDSIEK